MNSRLQNVKRTGKGRRHIRALTWKDWDLVTTQNLPLRLIVSVPVENRTHYFPTGSCKRFTYIGVDNDNRFVCHLMTLYQLKTLLSVD